MRATAPMAVAPKTNMRVVERPKGEPPTAAAATPSAASPVRDAIAVTATRERR